MAYRGAAGGAADRSAQARSRAGGLPCARGSGHIDNGSRQAVAPTQHRAWGSWPLVPNAKGHLEGALRWIRAAARRQGRESSPRPVRRDAASGGRHRLDGGRQSALVARGGVLVDQVLVGDAVDDRLGPAERLGGPGLVAGGDGLADRLDGGAKRRALARVALVAGDRLAGALARRCDVGHVLSVQSANRARNTRAR